MVLKTEILKFNQPPPGFPVGFFINQKRKEKEMLNLLLLTTAGFCAGYCFGAFLGTTKQKKEIIQLIKELEEDNAKMMNSFYLRDKCRRHSKPEDSFLGKN